MRMKGLVQDCSQSGDVSAQLEKIVTAALCLMAVRSWLVTEFEPIMYQDQHEHKRISRGTEWTWSSSADALLEALRDYGFRFDMLGVWLLPEGAALSSRSLPHLPQAYDLSDEVSTHGFDVQGEGCFVAVQGTFFIGVFGPDDFLAEVRRRVPELKPCE